MEEHLWISMIHEQHLEGAAVEDHRFVPCMLLSVTTHTFAVSDFVVDFALRWNVQSGFPPGSCKNWQNGKNDSRSCFLFCELNEHVFGEGNTNEQMGHRCSQTIHA